MKVKELLKVLHNLDEFDIKLIERDNPEQTAYFEYDLELNDIGYSEKIITLTKKDKE